MLSRVGAFLTTERGGWITIAATAVFCALAVINVGVSTFLLSVEAILLGVAVLVHQGQSEARDERRDVAAHGKWDVVIAALPKASNDAIRLEDKELADIERIRP